MMKIKIQDLKWNCITTGLKSGGELWQAYSGRHKIAEILSYDGTVLSSKIFIGDPYLIFQGDSPPLNRAKELISDAYINILLSDILEAEEQPSDKI